MNADLEVRVTDADRERAAAQGLPAPAPRPKARRFLVTLVGSEQRQGRWLLPRRLTAFSLIGAPDLVLRQAVIESAEVTITSFSLIGALTALVPAGLEVELGGLALIGGARLRRVSAHAG